MRDPPREPVQADIHELLRDEMMHIAKLSQPRRKENIARAAYLAKLASRVKLAPEHRGMVHEALERMLASLRDRTFGSPHKSRQKTYVAAARRALMKVEPLAAFTDSAPAIEDGQVPVHQDQPGDNAAGGDLPVRHMPENAEGGEPTASLGAMPGQNGGTHQEPEPYRM